MSTIRVETPNKAFSGKRLGITYTKGVAEAPAHLAQAFQQLGYLVREEQEQAPARSKRTRTPRERQTKKEVSP
mgnify:CR=1 FL=1